MKWLARLLQIMLYGLRMVIRIPLPETTEGHFLQETLALQLKKHGLKRVLFVTDNNVLNLSPVQAYVSALKNHAMDVTLYTEVHPNPHLDDVEKAYSIYHKHACQAIIGLGGGSVMDCAKGVAAKVARPKPLPQLKGLLKVRKKTPLMWMIPTTAGTGSEATVAAVISNPLTKEKYAISDPVLVPRYALLDTALVETLPPRITAFTGMDALTHAMEAFLNRYHTPFSRQAALDAFSLIYTHLAVSVANPRDLDHRRAMLKASYLAGCAFTRDYVGYVHGLAHPLGGFYDYPHGLANAILLPHVLTAYGPSIYPKLAYLYRHVKMGEEANPQKQALAVIAWIQHLNTTFQFPHDFQDVIQPDDIPLMVKRCQQEVIPFYPVPRYLSSTTLIHLYESLARRS